MGFSKLFESEKYGQILVKKDTNGEDKPEIRFYVNPDNLGICSVALAFNKDESTDRIFEGIDISMSEKVVGKVFEEVFNVFSEMKGA